MTALLRRFPAWDDVVVNPLRKLARKLGSQTWFAEVGKKLVPLDLAAQERTGGRFSLLGLLGLPGLSLTVTGRKSGLPRTVPLLYVPHGSEYVVVGSNWGNKDHPAWSANLLANRDAVIRVRAQEKPIRARLVTGAERERLWREVIAPVWPAYDAYADRAGDREIRVFALSPRQA